MRIYRLNFLWWLCWFLLCPRPLPPLVPPCRFFQFRLWFPDVVEVVPSRLDFGGGEHYLAGGVKNAWTSDRDERDDNDDDDLSVGELFDALVEVLLGWLLVFLLCLFILFLC